MRQIFYLTGLAATLSIVLARGAEPAGPAPAKAPNILFFLVDDLGQRDIGAYGSDFYETPNLDRLAAQGMKFTRAYAACPVCSPTRASIMTGKYPQRVGITDYIGAPTPEKWTRNTGLLPAHYSDRLGLEEVTLAEALKPAGYATFFAGKWHLGPEGFWPEDQGFDINKGGTDRGGPYGGKKYFSPYENPRLPDGPEGEHLPDRLATETNSFLTGCKENGRPFLAYLSFYDVHTPLMGREDLVSKYKAKKKELGLSAQWGEEPPRKVRLNQEHAVYAAMVEAMDQAVGKVLDHLDSLGLAENTLVVFTSDNGGLSTSEGSPTSNQPLRAGKGWLYEGGIREPLLIRWPGTIAPGTVSDTPVISPDFLPTFAEAAGVSLSKEQTDGVSLLPVLRGGAGSERPIFWHYPHYGNQGGAPGAAVTTGAWKLIEWFEDGKTELFDLNADPSETKNVAAENPGKVQELRAVLKDWQERVHAKFPAVNPAFDPSRPHGRVAGAK